MQNIKEINTLTYMGLQHLTDHLLTSAYFEWTLKRVLQGKFLAEAKFDYALLLAL